MKKLNLKSFKKLENLKLENQQSLQINGGRNENSTQQSTSMIDENGHLISDYAQDGDAVAS